MEEGFPDRFQAQLLPTDMQMGMPEDSPIAVFFPIETPKKPDYSAAGSRAGERALFGPGRAFPSHASAGTIVLALAMSGPEKGVSCTRFCIG